MIREGEEPENIGFPGHNVRECQKKDQEERTKKTSVDLAVGESLMTFPEYFKQQSGA